LNEHEKRVWSVDWSGGDPRLLASGSDDARVKLWSTNQERSVTSLEAKANVCCVKFVPESSYLIAFGSADHCIHYYDFRQTREPLGVLNGHKKAVSYVKFASTTELISASTDSCLKLWSTESMDCVRSFTGHTNEKNFVGLATDGNYLACGSENNSLYIYYKSLPKPLFSFRFDSHRSMMDRPRPDDSSEFVSAVAWKKGSPVVVAANSQGAIKVLELV
jgi:E3 ubiquitin-protein ligase RFWD2